VNKINVTFVPVYDVNVEGHKTLYKILNMEDVDVEKYEPLLHLYYCKFTSDVNAREITRQLLSCHILQ